MASGRLALGLILGLVVASPLAPAWAQGDWDVQRDPFDKTVIARLKATLAKQPHDAAALARLTTMYRKHRSLAQLTAEYAKLAQATGDGAALVVLGKLARASGDDEQALAHFQAALPGRGTDVALILDIGDALRRRGNNAEALATYRRVVAPSQAHKASDAVRAYDGITAIALATGDWPAAADALAKKLALVPSTETMLEYADVLTRAGQHGDAAKVLGDAEARLKADPMKRLEVIGRAASAMVARGDDAKAIAEYKRAIGLAPASYYLAHEYWLAIIEIYRRRQELPQLAIELEARWPAARQTFFEAETLARLYEQLGQPEKALASYRRAVAKAPWELETQRRYVALLEASGRSTEALAQLEAIGKIAPGEPQVALDLAERHFKRGDQKRALALALGIEKRFAGDASILASVADAYQRWGEAKRATAIYERIAAIDPDPLHLIALGEVYLNNGEASRAMATWEKIAASGSVAALLAAADVMAQNGGAKRALEFVARAEALEAKNYVVFRTKAMVLDALKLDVEALAAYKKALDLIDPSLVMERRDVRRRMISHLTRRTQSRALEMQAVSSWQTAFAARPPSLEAGYLLAMYYERRPADEEPIKTLTRLVALAPADLYALDDLAHAQVKARRYDDAVASLLAIADRDHARQQEMYTRIAEIKSMARDDEAALTWALKAVEGQPRHVEGHKRLAERYVEMQRIDEATKSYEAAIALDPNAASVIDVYFALASLYLQTGNTTRASELYREVLRRAVDEEQLAEAGRAAIEIGELTNTLGELEQTLAPLAFAMTHKPTYRQLLVGLYLRYIPVLATQATAAATTVAARARAELARLAGSALTPLLDVLHDDEQASAHGAAIAALEQLGNRAAARALIEFAKRPVPEALSLAGRGTSDLRVTALLAAGRLRTPDAVRLVGELLRSSDGAMREAAWFAVATQDPAAPLGAIAPALADPRTNIAVLGCVALAGNRDGRALQAAQRVAQDEGAHELVRAACLYAMSAQPAIPAASLAVFAALANQVGEVGRLATWALSRHRARGASRLEVIAQYWGEHHATAAAALVDALAGEPPLAAWAASRPSGRLDAAAIVAALGEARGDLITPDVPIAELAGELIDAAALALRAGDRDVKLQALRLLDQADLRLSFGRGGMLERALAPHAARLGAVVWPELWQLRAEFAAIPAWASVAAKACPDQDLGPMLEALSAAPPGGLAVALEALRRRERIALSDSLIKTLTHLSASADWRLRQLAATVGARLAVPSPSLVARCMRDRAAYVRASCVPPSGPSDAALADAIAPAVHDSNPAVRAAASRWLCAHAPTSAACAATKSDLEQANAPATTLSPL